MDKELADLRRRAGISESNSEPADDLDDLSFSRQYHLYDIARVRDRRRGDHIPGDRHHDLSRYRDGYWIMSNGHIEDVGQYFHSDILRAFDDPISKHNTKSPDYSEHDRESALRNFDRAYAAGWIRILYEKFFTELSVSCMQKKASREARKSLLYVLKNHPVTKVTIDVTGPDGNHNRPIQSVVLEPKEAMRFIFRM